MPLVLVGPASRWARELPDVSSPGAVYDDELAAIYTGAHALVFPSEEEGFGLPPVEALACGTPVAACDVPALREVLERPCDASDVDDLDGLVRRRRGARRPAPAPPPWTLGRRRGGDLAGLRGRAAARPTGGRPKIERGEPRLAPDAAVAARKAARHPPPRLNRPPPAPARGRQQPPRVAVAAEQVALTQQHVAEREHLVGRRSSRPSRAARRASRS